MIKRVAMKNRRQEMGITQLSLADKIGCKEREITLFETGRSSPTYGLACRISKVLEQPIEKLFPEMNYK